MYNWDYIEQLLRVAELCRGRPDLSKIMDAAHAELRAIADPPIETEEEAEETEDE